MSDRIQYDLYRILCKELKNGSSDMVTRQSGQVIREEIEVSLRQEPESSVIALDFTLIGIVDYSCADEVIAKLLSRLLSGEYGDKYILLTGINENQRENIEVALERKDLGIIACTRKGAYLAIGRLNDYLKETLQSVMTQGRITAKDLSESLGLEPNTSGTRLLNLHRKRLVKRFADRKDSGRVWTYELL